MFDLVLYHQPPRCAQDIMLIILNICPLLLAVKWGLLENKLYLFNCDMIKSEVAVVRNEPSNSLSNITVDPKSGWLVVSNCASWLQFYRNFILSYKKHKYITNSNFHLNLFYLL